MAWYRIEAALITAIGIAAAGAILPAQAQDRGASSAHRWEAMDNCNKDAFAHFPDYTVDGEAQREAYVRKCLRDQHLPPWTGYSTAPAKP